MNTIFTRFRPANSLIVVVFLLVACRNDSKLPVDRFQKSTTAAVAAISFYYNELNNYERTLYLQSVATDASQPLAVRDKNGRATPLLSDPFSATGIQARLALLQHLGNYAERLTSLNSTKSTDEFQTNVSALASNLTALQATFTSLSQTSDASAAQYVGPINSLVNVIGELLIRKKQQNALRQAIIYGEGPITNLLSFLRQDLEKYVSATRISGSLLVLSDQVISYNGARKKLTLAERQERLNTIAKQAKEYQLLSLVRPSEVVQQMQISHQALVKAVKSGNPLTLGLVLGAIDDYEAAVQRLLTATRALDDLLKK